MTSTSSVQHGATYQDLLNAPPTRVAELIQGTLYTSPRPAPKHALEASHLTMEVGTPFGPGRGGPGGRWMVDT